jgi:flagella basal body P-ring formation protein FlgA
MEKVKAILMLLAAFTFISFFHIAESAAREDSTAKTGHKETRLSEAYLQELFHDYLCQHLGKDDADIILSKFKVRGNRPIPEGEREIQVLRRSQRRLKGHVTLLAVVKVDGAVRNKVSLSGWVDLFEEAVCAGRDLKRGEILKAEDLSLSRILGSHISSRTLTHMEKAVGMRLKHRVKKNSTIQEWMLEKPSIVEKGDMVMIVAESGDLKVTVPGRVLEKGYLGDMVQVQNMMSKKMVYAQVINNAIVKVAF